LVSLDDIRSASTRIRPWARVTPLIDVAWPGPDGGDRRLWLKCENLQPMGAFKIRGATNMIRRLPPDALARGVITYSSGNHGQAVALAAREAGVPAVIVMPTTAPQVKIEGAKSYGAEVIFAGTTSAHRKARAEEVAAERGLTMVPPFDHEWIIAGQGTAGIEVLEQLPSVGTIYVAMGGGGLVAGVSAAVKQSRPDVRIVGVEPDGAPKMSRSLAAGHPVTLEQVSTIADGLMAVRPGDLNFAHVREYVDEVVTVSDGAIECMIPWFFRHSRLVVEPSGAVAATAVSLGLGHPQGDVVAFVSGGNVEPALYARLIQR
jgi:threonine dehydratase